MGKILIGFIIVIIVAGTISIIAFNRFRQKYYNRVTYNGNLKIVGTNVENQFGEVIQLRGVSSHGIQWNYYQCITDESLEHLRDNWKMNVFRVAMYIGQDGYIQNKEKMYARMVDIVEKCIKADIYVIVDWHITDSKEMNLYQEEAKEFFSNISMQYKDVPNLIYEICNEPNDASWEKEIVPYATEMIETIRKNSKNAIVIVGTPNYSRNILSPTNTPLKFSNVLYAYHFYANTHKNAERQILNYSYEQGIPIIVSEWGICDYTGDGDINYEESNQWIQFLNERNIGWVNWSYSYKDETSAILKKEIEEHLNENIENFLSKSGKYIEKLMKNTDEEVRKKQFISF